MVGTLIIILYFALFADIIAKRNLNRPYYFAKKMASLILIFICWALYLLCDGFIKFLKWAKLFIYRKDERVSALQKFSLVVHNFLSLCSTFFILYLVLTLMLGQKGFYLISVSFSPTHAHMHENKTTSQRCKQIWRRPCLFWFSTCSILYWFFIHFLRS